MKKLSAFLIILSLFTCMYGCTSVSGKTNSESSTTNSIPTSSPTSTPIPLNEYGLTEEQNTFVTKKAAWLICNSNPLKPKEFGHSAKIIDCDSYGRFEVKVDYEYPYYSVLDSGYIKNPLETETVIIRVDFDNMIFEAVNDTELKIDNLGHTCYFRPWQYNNYHFFFQEMYQLQKRGLSENDWKNYNGWDIAPTEYKNQDGCKTFSTAITKDDYQLMLSW